MMVGEGTSSSRIGGSIWILSWLRLTQSDPNGHGVPQKGVCEKGGVGMYVSGLYGIPAPNKRENSCGWLSKLWSLLGSPFHMAPI